jgi:hypothetical protein
MLLSFEAFMEFGSGQSSELLRAGFWSDIFPPAVESCRLVKPKLPLPPGESFDMPPVGNIKLQTIYVK